MRATPVVGGATALAFILGAGAIAVFAQEQPEAPAEPVMLASALGIAEHAELGMYLVDGEGKAVYLFTNDIRAEGEVEAVSNCTEECLANWPRVLIGDLAATPLTLAEGLDVELVGSVEPEPGVFQLTYNGWPVYYFAGDTEAGQTNGQGIGDVWFLLNPAGEGIGMPAAEEEAPPPAEGGGGE